MAMSTQHAAVLGVLIVSMTAASAADLARRRIPNGVSLATAAAGLTLAMGGFSGISVWSSIAGLVIGLMLMLPGHVLGATGAGDVKLFASAGAVLGAAQTIQAFLFVAIAGGVLALAYACARGRLARTLTRLTALFRRPSAAAAEIESPAENNRFPYGPAIAVGCVIAALW
jgi:prepilin peptidase CpaA